MTKVTIPQMDANLVDVTITRWNCAVGDVVQEGDCLAELTTDKAVYELAVPKSGKVLAIYAQAKSVVPVKYVIALIGSDDEVAPTEPPPENAVLMAAYQDPLATAERVDAKQKAPRIRATPRARRLAAEHNLDLAKIQAETNAKVIDEKVLAPYLEK